MVDCMDWAAAEWHSPSTIFHFEQRILFSLFSVAIKNNCDQKQKGDFGNCALNRQENISISNQWEYCVQKSVCVVLQEAKHNWIKMEQSVAHRGRCVSAPQDKAKLCKPRAACWSTFTDSVSDWASFWPDVWETITMMNQIQYYFSKKCQNTLSVPQVALKVNQSQYETNQLYSRNKPVYSLGLNFLHKTVLFY